MIPHHQPPPAPHPHISNLPPRQLHSQGDSEISYTVYSPSPSSLAVHRQKWARIRDWRTHHPHAPQMGSAGVGSASWSDTGTGLDEGQTDIGTIPTTVRVDRELRDEDTVVPDKRDRVDPRRHIGSQQSQARQRRRQEQEQEQKNEEETPSELPYRQTSQRRTHPEAPAPTRENRQPTAIAEAPQSPATNGQPSQPKPQRPPLTHTKSKSKPTPQLARPRPPTGTQVLPPGTPLVTSPEGVNIARPKNSPFAIREAYLNSALNLPLDMLAQVEPERQSHPTAEPQQRLKPTKSQSSLSSGLTTGRLASLMGHSRGPSPNGGVKRVVSDSQAVRGRDSGGHLVQPQVKSSRSEKPRDEAVETLITPERPRQMGSNSSSRTAKPAPAVAQQQQAAEPSRPIGHTALPRSVTAPVPTRSSPLRPQEVEASALGLTLGAPAAPPAITVSGPSDPPSSVPVTVQPAPHRQLLALRRPALTPRNSTDNLAQTLALGRKMRDRSMSDLRTRFEPATYPLPESQSSAATKSQTSNSAGAGGGAGGSGSAARREAGKQPQPPPALGSRASQKHKAKTTSTQPAASGPTSLDPNALISALQPPKGPARATSKGHTPYPSPRRDMPPAMSSSQTLPTPVVASLPIPIGVAGEMLGGGAAASAPAPADVPMSPSFSSGSPPQPAPPPAAAPPFSPTPEETMSSPPPTSTNSYPEALARPPAKDRRVDRIREDDDRVSFEVPNGTRGRLRVSLAWFRDRGRGRGSSGGHTDGQVHMHSPMDTPPPPLPPKPRTRREHGRQREPIPDQFTSSGGDPTTESSIPIMSMPGPVQVEPRRPSPMPFAAGPMRVPTPLRPVSPAAAPEPHAGYPPFDPFRPRATVPAYRPPFQLPPHPFAYPQPHPQPHPPWASHPQLPGPGAHVQFQQPAPGQGSRRPPPAPESVDPPSAGNTPPAPPPMGLPGMAMGPMGLQSGMINPYSTHSLHPMAGTQSRVGFQAQGQGDYDRQRQPMWRRMFNPRSQWQDNGGGSQDEHDYGARNNGTGNGNDRIGRWMSGITPGRAPPLRAQTAPATAAGYLNGNQQGQGQQRRDYSLTRPFFRRGGAQRQDPYNNTGGGNAGFWPSRQQRQQQAPHSPDMYGLANGNGNGDPYASTSRRSVFRGPRQGGMLDRMFTPLQRTRTPGNLYSTGQPRQTTAFDARDRYNEARRREKADRRNARAQGMGMGRHTQPRDYSVPFQQPQRQRATGAGGGGLRNWVIRLGNNNNNSNYGGGGGRERMGNGNGYGYGYGPQPNGGTRKLSRNPGGRWSDRLPRSTSNRRGYGNDQGGTRSGQRVYTTNNARERTGRGGTGLGLGMLGNAFRR